LGFGGAVCLLLLLALQLQKAVWAGGNESDVALRQSRAYVTVKQIVQKPIVDPANSQILGWRLTTEWQNTGITPTKDMITWTTKRLFLTVPEDFDFPRPPEAADHSSVIGPGATLRASPIFIPIADLEKTRVKQGTILLWGRFEYNDVFDGTPRHQTSFCAEVSVDGNINVPEGTPLRFLTCPHHNSND
jgi:hypothetical protein